MLSANPQAPRARSMAVKPPLVLFIRSDARLHKDDVDICFSKTLNSCKVPQIRYASVERLLERLTDLRFLSIDFLNTFLHTYRIFTTAAVVMEKLADIYKKPFTSIPIRYTRLTRQCYLRGLGSWLKSVCITLGVQILGYSESFPLTYFKLFYVNWNGIKPL